MPTPSDPTGRPSSAKFAVPGTSSDPPATPAPKNSDQTGELPLPARSGSTDSHKPSNALSDFVVSTPRPSAESDIAQFLAHPQAVPGNTDDAPTVITQGNKQTNTVRQQASQLLPVIVSGEVPTIAGRRLGHFELIEAVGAGGMAAVLKARDMELGRIVALKILPPEAARDPESVNRFKQEARAAAALDHENIARVYYCGEDQGLNFIAFEFVEGINLRQMIDRRGLLPAVECVRYMMQVAAGLNHAAERGVVHRDIKPSNILITPDGRAKIVDMGLARHLGSEAVNGGVTQSGVTLGTFDYISPEQALDPRRADVRSDIYSLGCTFYHALTGRPPVPEGTAAKKLRAHQYDQPLDPRELNPAIPDEVAAVLARMMAKDPTQRYQTPTELIAHLKGLAERLHLDADPLAHDTAAKAVPAETRLLPEAPHLRPWWLLAASAVVIAIAAFVVATSNPGPAPGPPLPPDQTKLQPAEQFLDTKAAGFPKSVANPPAIAPVKTIAELVQKLQDPNTTTVQLAAGEFDLTKLDHAVVFQGKSLELVGATKGITRLTLVASRDRRIPGTLALKATESLTIRNVWFDLKLDPGISVEATGVTQPVGLRLDDAARVTLTDCVFAATHEKLKNHEPRSVAITRADGVCQISALRCVFASGAVGLVVPGGSPVSISDCGFGQYSACVLIDSASPGEAARSEIRLDHSSFVVDPGGAVIDTRFSPEFAAITVPTNVRVTASDCLFAPFYGGNPPRSPFSASEANRRGAVIRIRAEKAEGVSLQVPEGHTNGYYNVDPVGTSKSTLSFEDCKELATIAQKGHAELRQRPWSDPKLLTTVESDSPWKAFRLKVDPDTDPDPALFTRDSMQRWAPLGVAFYNQLDNVRRAYEDITWGFSRPKTAEAKKIWWPTATDDQLVPGVYTELRALLKYARPDETIYIHHTGPLPVDNEEIKSATKPSEGDLRLTFKPDVGSRPILVIQGDKDYDQSLFKLKSGEVTFEGIHFRLKPDRTKNEVVAAVAIIGGRSCTFKNCLFSMAEEDDVRVAAVYLPDARKIMMMEPMARAPRVVFDHCLIRGRGRAMWVEVSRPVNLEMTDTLTALDGPVFFAEAGGVDGSGPSSAKLTRVTALAGGPIIEMRGKTGADAMRPGGLVKLDVTADSCLFVAVPGAGRPLVELEGVDPADVKAVLSWRVPKGNRYANFDAAATMAIIRPGGDGLAKEWTRSNWIDNVGEPPPDADKRFGELKFTTSISGLKELAALKPADVGVQMADFPDLPGEKKLDVGVDLAELKKLPATADEMKPE